MANKKVFTDESLATLVSETKTYVDSAVSTKANSSHTHDDRYYTESEVNNLLSKKADSSHGTHVSYSTTAPVMDGTASAGSASTVARSDHKHPTDTSRAAAADLKSHTDSTTVHITSTERTNWNSAKTHADSAHAPSNAEKNQNAFSNVTVDSTTIAADSTTDTLTVAAGTGISVSADATNDKITITNSGVRSIGTGSSNGTISVNTNGASANVAVKGLGSAAYTASTAYDAAGTAQTKADAALASAKSYADTKIANLLNNSTEAVDSIMELAAAMEANEAVVDALESAIGTKTDKAFSNVTVGSTTIAADGKADTLTLASGGNITITPDATNDKVTFTVADGTTGVKGVVKLSSTVADNETLAATPKAVKSAYDLANTAKTTADGKAPTSHASTGTSYGIGTNGSYGHVKLSDATNSASSTGAGIAATPAAVKSAYDLANSKAPITYKSYSTFGTASTGTDGWYTIFTMKDDTIGSAICLIKAYAHSSCIFTVSKGYSTNTTLNILDYNASSNGSYAYVKGIRILSDGKVQAKFQTGTVNISIHIVSASGQLKPVDSLVCDTSNPEVQITRELGASSQGKITATGFVGDLTGTTSKVAVTATSAPDGTTYDFPLHSGTDTGSKTLYTNKGLRYWTWDGDSSSVGHSTLQIGNAVASGNGHKAGSIMLFGTKIGYTELVPTNNTPSNITINLPDTYGTLALDKPATQSSSGLMSAADKTKLDGIATGANKITVDTALSSTSTNPVQNKVINTALSGKSNTSHNHDDSYLKLSGGTLTGAVSTSSTISVASGQHVEVGNTQYKDGHIQLRGEFPFIGFYYDNADASDANGSGYTTRIQEYESGKLSISGHLRVGGNVVVGDDTSTDYRAVYARNSLHSGGVHVSEAGNLGVISSTHNKWLIYMNKEGNNAYVPCTLNASGGVVGNLTGNASTATKLATARAINGVNFDGTAPITITANPTETALTGINLNTITTPGFYYGGGNNGCTNVPPDYGIDAFGMIVFKTASGYTSQMLIGGNNSQNFTFIRTSNGTSWSAWSRYATYSELNSVYSDIENSLTNKAPKSHNHAASEITSGTLGVARGGTGATTFTSGAALIGAGTGAVTTRAITNMTSKNYITYNTNLMTTNTLAYWNGAYQSNGASNLTYCNQGAFGSIVTKGSGDYVSLSGGLAVIGSSTSTSRQAVSLWNSNRQSALYLSADGGFGLFNNDNNTWHLCINKGSTEMLAPQVPVFRVGNSALTASIYSYVQNTKGKMGICVGSSGNMGIVDDGTWIIYQNAAKNTLISPLATFQIGANAAGSIKPHTTNKMSCGASGAIWTQLFAKTSTISSSDRNQKKDFREFSSNENYEKFFMDLKPTVYKFKDGESGRDHFGFISQDVEDSLYKFGFDDKSFAGFCRDVRKVNVGEEGEEKLEPVLDEDGNIQYDYALRYSEFIPLNTYMIQKLAKENQELKEECVELRTKNEELETRLQAIENIIAELKDN